MKAFDTLSVFSSARHNIIGHAMFGLLFRMTLRWLSPVDMLNRRHKHGHRDVRAAIKYQISKHWQQ